jgi:hypothetical protein
MKCFKLLRAQLSVLQCLIEMNAPKADIAEATKNTATLWAQIQKGVNK